MVDSWITFFSILFEMANYRFIHGNPHSVNNLYRRLDRPFPCFSTSVDEKDIRKTILPLRCQRLWNK